MYAAVGQQQTSCDKVRLPRRVFVPLPQLLVWISGLFEASYAVPSKEIDGWLGYNGRCGSVVMPINKLGITKFFQPGANTAFIFVS